MFTRALVLTTLVLVFSGCAFFNKPQNHIVILEYADFGPQAMAYPLLGKDKTLAASTLDDKPIFVVVYSNIPLKQVKKKYPSKPNNFVEYRYLERDVALDYLKDNINKRFWGSLTQKLSRTRSTIVNALSLTKAVPQALPQEKTINENNQTETDIENNAEITPTEKVRPTPTTAEVL